MSIEDNKALLRRWFGMEDFRDLPEAELEKTMRKVGSELFDPDFVMHTPEGEMPLEVCVQHTLELMAAFPDVSFPIDDMVVEGDKVALRLTIRGTHQGPYRGIPATGKKVNVGGIGIVRYTGGKFAEVWRYTDTLGLVQQLGAIPKQ